MATVNLLILSAVVAVASPSWGPDDLVRVDDPGHPDAVARSRTGALVIGIPDGPWRPASLPEPDVIDVDTLAEPPVAGREDDLLEILGAGAWHDAGARGQGVRVAIFDSRWFGGATDPDRVEPFTTHDCFASTTCAAPIGGGGPAYASESGNHGWACAEVVRQLAPEAEVALVRVNTFTALENAVDWAIREEVDVVSMSMSYYNDSFTDGGGPFGPLLRRLEDAGVLMVTSSGNTADQHWWSNWVDGDHDGVLDGPRTDAVDGLAGRAEAGLWWSAPAGPITASVNWNQYGACGGTDLSVRVVDEDGWVVTEVDREQDPDGETCSPTERLRAVLRSDRLLRIEVAHERGPVEDLVVDVLVRSGTLVDPDPTRSLTDPGAHPLAFTVGAVPLVGYGDAEPQPYSSWGPNHAGEPAIDLGGPDGLSTASYGPVGFYGTSASTPAVAGLVAVVMSADEGRSSRDASELLQGWALRDSAEGRFDPRWGAGKARLPYLEPALAPCGQRPLLLAFWLPWLPWWRTRRRLRLGESDDGARSGRDFG
jgi:hypothetical protein